MALEDDTEGHLIAETKPNGKLIRSYLWAGNEPIAQLQTKGTNPEELSYLHSDHLNTPRLATNPTQTVVWRFESEAFGTGKPDTDPDADDTKTNVRLRFPGQVADGESGLYYNWNRYYDPKIGRYVTSDPVGLTGGANTYTYANLSPLRYVDPSGLSGIDTLFLRDDAPIVVIGRAFGGLAAYLQGITSGDEALTDAAAAGLAESREMNVEALAVVLSAGRSRPVGQTCPTLNAAQQGNLAKFLNKIPANAKANVVLQPLPNGGVAAQATSPGRVPGSKAVYEKQIDSTGKTIQYTKTTYDPQGNIVNVKDKIGGGTYP